MLCQTHLMLYMFSYKRVKFYECLGFIDTVSVYVLCLKKLVKIKMHKNR